MIVANDTDQQSPVSHGIQGNGIYRAGGIAALVIVLFSLIQIVVFVLSPPPSNVTDWFALYQRNWLVGLLDFDLLYILDNILMIFVYLAFYVSLYRKNQALLIVATVIGLVAIAAFFASNNAFSMLTLSRQYAAAPTEAERAIFLAAGQTMVSLFSGTSYIVFTVLGSVAPIIISISILKYGVFSKTTAWMGIVANVLPFGLFIDQVGKYFGLLSVPFLIIWFLLTALRLFKLNNAK
jgi:hypothetical protein